jgi:hypothetical protein
MEHHVKVSAFSGRLNPKFEEVLSVEDLLVTVEESYSASQRPAVATAADDQPPPRSAHPHPEAKAEPRHQ